MEQRTIYLRGKEKDFLLSYSAEELEELIDDLNLSMVGFKNDDVEPFLKAIGLLTEIKMLAKK